MSLRTQKYLTGMWNRIAEQSAVLQDLKTLVEGNLSSGSLRQNFSSISNTPNGISPVNPDSMESTKSPADQDTENAPVILIRNVLRKAHGGPTRLSYYGIQGLLNLGLVPRSNIHELLNLYVFPTLVMILLTY